MADLRKCAYCDYVYDYGTSDRVIKHISDCHVEPKKQIQAFLDSLVMSHTTVIGFEDSDGYTSIDDGWKHKYKGS